MSLNAKYEADFNSFYDAVNAANAGLDAWEKSGERVEAQMNDVAGSLSGIQANDAINAATFNMNELAKSAGDVPKKVEDIADESATLPPIFSQIGKTAAAMFTISAITSFAKEMIALGSEVKTLALSLDMTYDEVQKLQGIAQGTSTPINALAKGIQTLQERLGDDNSGAVAALDKLGISLDEFTGANEYDKLIMLSDGFKQIGSQEEFAKTAADLFGGSWRTMAPALKSDIKEIGDNTLTWSNETVENLGTAEAAWNSFANVVKYAGGTLVGALADFFSTNPEWDKQTTKIPVDAVKVADAFDQVARAGDGVKLSQEELNAILKKSNDDLAESIAKNTELAEAQAELDSAGAGWKGTLALMNQETVTAIKGYLDAGVSQKALATVYGLTATQVKAVASAMKEENDELEKQEKLARVVGDMWRETYQIQAEQIGTSTDIAVAEIDRWAQTAIDRAKEAGIATAEFYDALAALTHERMNNVLIDWNAIADNSQEAYARNLAQVADKAEATFQYMIGHSESFSVATLQHFGEVAQAARDAANNWRESWTEAADGATAAVEKSVERVTAVMSEAFGGNKNAPGSVGINTEGISFGSVSPEAALKAYTARFGTGSAAGMIGGGPPPDFLSWAMSMGLAGRAPTFPPTGGAGVTNNINLNGLLGTDDPQTRSLIKDLVGEAFAESMRGQRLLSSA